MPDAPRFPQHRRNPWMRGSWMRSLLTATRAAPSIPTSGRTRTERPPVAVLKKSVAFDEAVGHEALERAGERGFSRFVNDAVAQRLQALRILDLLAEMDAEHGGGTPGVKGA